MCNIVRIGLVLIGFAFKTDITVGSVTVAVPYQPVKVFATIPNIKGQHKHFGLLAQVYALMRYNGKVVFQAFIPNKNKRVERNACKTFRN